MTTISTIGAASRNYSTIAGWLAAFATGGWQGECYNDPSGEFTVTSTISFSGHATSATDFIKLTAASGQSFQDNANVQTNALAYNASNGVGIRKTNGYSAVIVVAEGDVAITRLQISHDGTGTTNMVYDCNSVVSRVLVDSCLEELKTPNIGIAAHRQRSGNVVNTLIVNRGGLGNGIDFSYPNGTPSVVNVTLVRTSNNASAGTALFSAAGNWTAKNSAFFGFSTLNSGGTATSCNNNCSDLAIGFGSSNQASKTFANQFVTTTDTGRDFKAKAAGDILDTGVDVSATYTGTTLAGSKDIANTTRPQGSAWDIGCWELVSGGGSTPWQSFIQDNQPLPDTRRAVAI